MSSGNTPELLHRTVPCSAQRLGTPPNDRLGPRLLCIGEDRFLLDIRKLLLEQAGYSVITLPGVNLPATPPVPAVAVAIICHSVHEPYRSHITDWMRQTLPKTRILLLSRGGDSRQERLGYSLSGTRPEELLKSIRELVEQAFLQP
jgi:hypothetical protein